MAQVIEGEFRVSYDPSKVGRILKGCGFSLQKPALRSTQRDEQAIREWRDWRFGELKKGHSRRKDHSVVRRIGVLPAAGPAADLGPGGPEPVIRRKLSYDHLNAISAISMTRELYLAVQEHSYKGAADVIRFLEQLLAQIPGKLLVIWDGAPIHRSRAVREPGGPLRNALRRPRERACSREGGGWVGPVRGAAVGWLVPAHHAGDAGPRLSDGDQASGNRRGRKRGHYGPDEELIPVTVPEVRRLLTRLVWTETQPPDFILYWSWWRRRHQARAQQCHYKDANHICDCSTKPKPR